MGRVQIRVAAVAFLILLVFPAPTNSQDEISLRVPVYWNMARQFQKEVGRFGGLLGIRIESKVDLSVSRNVHVFAYPWYRLCGWVSEASTLGPYEASILSEFEMRVGISAYNANLFGGYHTVYGTSILDWLTEDTSDVAGDSKYDQELHESYELGLRGPIIGCGYSIRTESSGNYRFITLSAYMMFIDHNTVSQRYYFYEIDYVPGGNGVCYIATYGQSSTSNLHEFSFGVGYQFDL